MLFLSSLQVMTTFNLYSGRPRMGLSVNNKQNTLERINTNLNKEKLSFFDENLNQVFKKPNYFAFW